jgi:hypothetical protein
MRKHPESSVTNNPVQPEIDDANEIELWGGARIGLPRAVIDNAKRRSNHSRACKEV